MALPLARVGDCSMTDQAGRSGEPQPTERHAAMARLLDERCRHGYSDPVTGDWSQGECMACRASAFAEFEREVLERAEERTRRLCEENIRQVSAAYEAEIARLRR